MFHAKLNENALLAFYSIQHIHILITFVVTQLYELKAELIRNVQLFNNCGVDLHQLLGEFADVDSVR